MPMSKRTAMRIMFLVRSLLISACVVVAASRRCCVVLCLGDFYMRFFPSSARQLGRAQYQLVCDNFEWRQSSWYTELQHSYTQQTLTRERTHTLSRTRGDSFDGNLSLMPLPLDVCVCCRQLLG